MGLQYGVPLRVLVNKFIHSRFEPAGYTQNEDIRFAKSLVDYIFRWLGLHFVEGFRGEEVSPTKSETEDETAAGPPAAATAAGPAKPELSDGDAELNYHSQFSRFQQDAPSCDVCGSITVRNGNCYRCHNCGNSMGCS
jgi:ribonucleoside-diphosphate reductase alpha chain